MTTLLAILATSHPRGVLEHPTRRRIYDHILLLPGDHFRSIVRSLRLGLGTVRHHLDVLSTEGWVRPERVESGRVRYYAKGKQSAPHMNRLYEQHWSLRDLRTRVLLSVISLRDARPSSVARSLGISRQLAAYHLARLREAGHVRRVAGAYRASTTIDELLRVRR